MKVTAKVQRSGGWWAVEVPEVPGVFTQARRLDQVAEQVADAVATMLDVDDLKLEVAIEPAIEASEAVAEARAAASQASAAQSRASEAMRAAVRRLREEEDLPLRDVAVLLGVSHQRVSQLEKASLPSRLASTPVTVYRSGDVPLVIVSLQRRGGGKATVRESRISEHSVDA